MLSNAYFALIHRVHFIPFARFNHAELYHCMRIRKSFFSLTLCPDRAICGQHYVKYNICLFIGHSFVIDNFSTILSKWLFTLLASYFSFVVCELNNLLSVLFNIMGRHKNNTHHPQILFRSAVTFFRTSC